MGEIPIRKADKISFEMNFFMTVLWFWKANKLKLILLVLKILNLSFALSFVFN